MCILGGEYPLLENFLLGIAHPVLGPPLRYRETTLLRGRDCEGGQYVALSNIFVKVFCIRGFYKNSFGLLYK